MAVTSQLYQGRLPILNEGIFLGKFTFQNVELL